jgi:hypothetical protein
MQGRDEELDEGLRVVIEFVEADPGDRHRHALGCRGCQSRLAGSRLGGNQGERHLGQRSFDPVEERRIDYRIFGRKRADELRARHPGAGGHALRHGPSIRRRPTEA